MSIHGTLSENYTYTASGDLSALQYHVMTNRSGRYAILSTSGGDPLIAGVLQNKPKNGEFASVGQAGRGFIVAAQSFGAQGWLTSNTSGRAVVAVSGDIVVARAVEAASADGDVVTVIYNITGPLRGAVA